MKYLQLFALLIAMTSVTEARQFTCDATQPGEPRILLEWGDLVLEEVFYAGHCNLRVHQPHTKMPDQFRNFSFSDAGEIYIYSEFANPHNPKSTYATSGTKGYYLFPLISGLKAVYNDQGLEEEFYIRTPSGEQIFFRNNPLRIDEQKTTDLEIHQQQVAYDNAGGLMISKPRGVLLNIGYLQGGSERVQRKLLLEDAMGNSCNVAHRNLFDYYKKSYQVRKGSCPATLTAGCRCVDQDTEKERTVCDFERKMAYSEVGSRSVDGYKPKAEIETIIEQRCPQLTSLALARADTAYLFDDLMVRAGLETPHFRPHSEAAAVDGPKWSFNLVEGIKSIFN